MHLLLFLIANVLSCVLLAARRVTVNSTILVQWNLSVVDTIGTQLAVQRGVPSLEKDLDIALCGWDYRQCPPYRGVPYSECPL